MPNIKALGLVASENKIFKSESCLQIRPKLESNAEHFDQAVKLNLHHSLLICSQKYQNCKGYKLKEPRMHQIVYLPPRASLGPRGII